MLRAILFFGVSSLMVAWIAGIVSMTEQASENIKLIFLFSLGFAVVNFGIGLILRAFGRCLLDQGSRSISLSRDRQWPS